MENGLEIFTKDGFTPFSIDKFQLLGNVLSHLSFGPCLGWIWVKLILYAMFHFSIWRGRSMRVVATLLIRSGQPSGRISWKELRVPLIVVNMSTCGQRERPSKWPHQGQEPTFMALMVIRGLDFCEVLKLIYTLQPLLLLWSCMQLCSWLIGTTTRNYMLSYSGGVIRCYFLIVLAENTMVTLLNASVGVTGNLVHSSPNVMKEFTMAEALQSMVHMQNIFLFLFAKQFTCRT